MGDLGAGVDVVSEGEYRRARAAGIPPERIVFSGVGKTRAEMRTALEGGLRQVNVESEPEMAALNEVALCLGTVAPMTLRVNPDIDAGTHDKISTGRAEDKFGVPIERAREIYAAAARLPGLRVVGIDMHIGSQLTSLAPFEAAYTRLAELTRALRADGHAIERLDVGGGLGIPYRQDNLPPPLPSDYGALIRRTLGDQEAVMAFNAGTSTTSLELTREDLSSSTFERVWPQDNYASGLPLTSGPETVRIPGRETRVWVSEA